MSKGVFKESYIFVGLSSARKCRICKSKLAKFSFAKLGMALVRLNWKVLV